MTHHVLLALSVLALGAAGSRAAAALGATGARPRPRGRADLRQPRPGSARSRSGSSTSAPTRSRSRSRPARCGSRARARAPRAAANPVGELAAEWERLADVLRLLLGAFAGIVLALAVWLLRNPALVGDGLVYHSPIVATWVSGRRPAGAPRGRPGRSARGLSPDGGAARDLGGGDRRSFAAISLWNPADAGAAGARRLVGTASPRRRQGRSPRWRSPRWRRAHCWSRSSTPSLPTSRRSPGSSAARRCARRRCAHRDCSSAPCSPPDSRSGRRRPPRRSPPSASIAAAVALRGAHPPPRRAAHRRGRRRRRSWAGCGTCAT